MDFFLQNQYLSRNRDGERMKDSVQFSSIAIILFSLEKAAVEVRNYIRTRKYNTNEYYSSRIRISAREKIVLKENFIYVK